MTHDFIYHNPTKVYFGNGMLAHLPEEISRLGSRVLLITGGSSAKKSGLFDKVLAEISKANVDCYGLSGVKPNPEIGLVREGIRLVREKRLDLILALGGGSVLDTAKVIAGSAPYDADPWDLIRSRAAIDTALPLITIPTIAATGSEMNASAVITNPETEEKYGWTAQAFRPSVSFLCPENTYTVPAYQTACGSADILSHIMEVYFQKEETFPATEAYMEAMMRSVMKDAPIAMA
ncbi:MAG: iron-containing alcohol dehydrogenase, partial [Dialister sp.]|nr:iron-containing alcohol dehydrogenase [Dialister sp.]MDY6114819.1 iron-containing alcohol dehydrogenase [Dialister sp.]